MKATFVRNLTGFAGSAKLYRCEPGGELPEFVVVSATYAMFSGEETYVFPADADGKVSDWGELPGSYRGDLDHEQALRDAGYEIGEVVPS